MKVKKKSDLLVKKENIGVGGCSHGSSGSESVNKVISIFGLELGVTKDRKDFFLGRMKFSPFKYLLLAFRFYSGIVDPNHSALYKFDIDYSADFHYSCIPTSFIT